MIEATIQVKALTKSQLSAAFDAMPSPRFKFIVALQAYVGLRISEVLSLRIKDFNFPQKTLQVKELKHRKENAKLVTKHFPQIVLDYAVNYYETLKSKDKDDYMFPAATISKHTHFDRRLAWRYIKGKTGWNPHCFRHTFVTMLVDSGLPVHEVQKMVGHSRIDTTMIYYNLSDERKRANVEAIVTTTFFERVKKQLFPAPSKVHLLPITEGGNFYVGRRAEIEKLHELKGKNVNTLLLGDRGVGKTTMLKNFKADNLLEIHDFDNFKKTLANMLLHLNREGKEALIEMMSGDVNVITKGSPKHIAEWLCKITQKHEFTIVIDDATRVTNAVIPALEILTKHFHMIVGARSIPIAQGSWLSSFQKIQINPLNRAESIQLIRLKSDDFKTQIEDVTAFETAVFSATNGNPLAIGEMVQRWRVEGYVRADAIEAITHTGARNERNIIPFLLFGIALFALAKVYGREADEGNKNAYMMMSGVAVILLMLSTKIMSAIKRKFV